MADPPPPAALGLDLACGHVGTPEQRADILGTAGFAALAALPNGVFTGTMNAAADKTKLQTLLQEAFTAGVNNSYLNITADVSAVVPM